MYADDKVEDLAYGKGQRCADQDKEWAAFSEDTKDDPAFETKIQEETDEREEEI